MDYDKKLKRNREWKKRNKEKVTDYMKEWRKNNKDKIRVSAKKFREKHKDDNIGLKRKKQISEWGKNNRDRINKRRKELYHNNLSLNRGKARIRIKNYNKKNPKKIIARNKSRSIKIPKGYMCEVCNKKLAIERHHENYDKELEVILCCKKCHIELNKQKRLRDEKNKKIEKELNKK